MQLKTQYKCFWLGRSLFWKSHWDIDMYRGGQAPSHTACYWKGRYVGTRFVHRPEGHPLCHYTIRPALFSDAPARTPWGTPQPASHKLGSFVRTQSSKEGSYHARIHAAEISFGRAPGKPEFLRAGAGGSCVISKNSQKKVSVLRKRSNCPLLRKRSWWIIKPMSSDALVN